MIRIIAGVAALSLAVCGAALAQPNAPASPLNSSSQPSSTASSADQSPTQRAAAQKIKQDLQNAGFQNVEVVAESFLVQAKTKDGNAVVMTIRPHGMTMIEAVDPKSSNSDAQTGNSEQSSSSSKK
jgi:hypothetical protein